MAKKQSNEQNGVLFHRDVPKMPEGYYSGDKPNPNLRAFVEAHLRDKPYDPETDDYDVPAFDTPIETTKATAIYNMHTYWSKKPHDAIRQYIDHYTEPGDMVLDPFCGSGGTALAAVMDGRKAIAIDRSPAATFITKNYCTPVDVNELRRSFADLVRKVKPEMDWLHETKCERCGGKATTDFSVYSQQFRCPRCNEVVPLFDCVTVEVVATDSKGRPVIDATTGREKTKSINACPHCYAKGRNEEISTRSQRLGSIPVLVSYTCQCGCRPAKGERRHNDIDEKKRLCFEQYDLGKLREIEAKEIPHWYPTDRMMHAPDDQACWGVKWRAGTSNFRTVDELFTKRNLWALAALVDAAKPTDSRDVLLFAITGICLGFSKMCQYLPGASYPFPMMRGTYYLPQVSKEQNVPHYYQNRVDLIQRAALQIDINGPVFVSTQSACDMSNIPSNSLDYVFTDPPYAENVQYGELNFIWESWLGLDSHWHGEEIIVNAVRGKTETDWADMMRSAMAECLRVLKPGRWLSLCYHDTSEGTWALVQDIMAEVGFVVDSSESALFIDTQQKSYNQLTADKVNKRDLVINFRKPRPGEVSQGLTITGDEDETTFRDKVQAIIRDYLSANPGSTKDRVYDEVVSRMVRTGQMEAHNFDELLSQVAEEVREELPDNGRGAGRWYLKESEVNAVDSAESAKEDAAARKIQDFISEWLGKNLGAEGVHYSDIFEHYVYTVQDKPRRSLADWLLDYFYKTDSGTYRLPGSEEEERIKAEARASGTSRRIKHYIAHLQQGTPVMDRDRPSDATLAEWIRHCKRSSLYEQGKLLYERGGLNLDNLSEEAMVNVEEDYQVCARMLARNGGNEKKTRKRGG